MAQQTMGGAGAASTIDINPDEMTHIAKELLAIANEFEGVIKPAINQLKANKYLTKGKAKKAMDKVPKANERVMELQDQYNMASSVVFDILQTMVDADRDIAEKIIAALEV
ncbi:TPA: hypothetical protein ACSK7M_001719 [Listeria innocua]|uniref:Lin0058 protein n=1 Tax=Listeria innocua serovar 6a (strain ATCC BAA-680 / CLIP 11262) TaxID=272626 RepID=Q92FP5_LISIN|nr:hypothetical protein [Listeria innocua]EAD5687391.1 hypothetical protein [Listeria innocua]ECC1680551.1 hypothetical protein [Listeria innocua]EEQ0537224.1 hypothetical protein [Listeria innocua]EHD9220731.1 hypothetical protein [Listeria innocua]EHF3595807.1 hypothetical protein [Listeria innocua]